MRANAESDRLAARRLLDAGAESSTSCPRFVSEPTARFGGILKRPMMTFRMFTPAPPLAEFVDVIWTCRGRVEPHKKERLCRTDP